jgi:hypothetical protein
MLLLFVARLGHDDSLGHIRHCGAEDTVGHAKRG